MEWSWFVASTIFWLIVLAGGLHVWQRTGPRRIERMTLEEFSEAFYRWQAERR